MIWWAVIGAIPVSDIPGSRECGRRGDIFEITGGSMLPGLGRVETIKRQDGDWVVVAVRGIIAPVPSGPSVIPAERVQ